MANRPGLKFMVVLALAMGPAAWAADFCWKATYGRGVGTIPPSRVADCPSTYTNNGATCGRGADTIGAPSKVADCPSTYTNNGATCGRGADTYHAKSTTADCPKGWTNMGLYCGKGIHTKGMGSMTCGEGRFKKGARCYVVCKEGYTNTGEYCTRGVSTLSMDHMTCPDGYFRTGGRCYKNCPDGYTNTGETCFKPVSTLGMDRMTCRADEVKHGARCYPSNSCGAGRENDAGLCYTQCRAGFHGVGPVCWGQPPTGWVNCGMGAARHSGTCAATIAGEVISTGMVALDVATAGQAFMAKYATGGAGEAEEASQLVQQFNKLKALYKAHEAEIKGLAAAKTITVAAISANELNDEKNLNPADITRLAAQIAALVDPTGVSGAVAAFSYPKCDTIR